MKRSFTIIELIVVAGIVGIVATLIVGLFVSGWRVYHEQDVQTQVQEQAKLATNTLTKYIEMGAEVLDKYDFDGDNQYTLPYETASPSVLILKIPSLNAEGKNIPDVYDYIAFYLEDGKLKQKIKKDPQSSRTEGEKIIAELISEVEFSPKGGGGGFWDNFEDGNAEGWTGRKYPSPYSNIPEGAPYAPVPTCEQTKPFRVCGGQPGQGANNSKYYYEVENESGVIFLHSFYLPEDGRVYQGGDGKYSLYMRNNGAENINFSFLRQGKLPLFCGNGLSSSGSGGFVGEVNNFYRLSVDSFNRIFLIKVYRGVGGLPSEWNDPSNEFTNPHIIGYKAAPANFNPNIWHKYEIEKSGKHFKVYLDGSFLFEGDDNTDKDSRVYDKFGEYEPIYEWGTIGVWAYFGKGGSASFDEISVETSMGGFNSVAFSVKTSKSIYGKTKKASLASQANLRNAPSVISGSSKVTATLEIQPRDEASDTYADEQFPTENFGSVTILTVGVKMVSFGMRSTYYPKRIFYKLPNINNYIPSNAKVWDACFIVWRYCPSDNCPSDPQGVDTSIGLYELNGPWDESTLTWNTQPPSNSNFYSKSYINAITSSVRNGFNLTNLLQKWVNGPSGNNGFVLKWTGESSPVQFLRMVFSSDYTDSNPQGDCGYIPPGSCPYPDGCKLHCQPKIQINYTAE